MSNIDREYHELCREILREGYEYVDESRNIVCKQISSHTIEVDKIFTHFPLITTKKMFTKGIIGELIWFLRGDSNIKYLNENKITIWNKDAYNWHKKLYPGTLMQQQNFGKQVLSFDDNPLLGDVGRNYGVQWREWTHAHSTVHSIGTVEKFDQISNLIQNLIVKPMSRRHIVTAWNPAELDETALPPCHWAFEIIPYPIADEYKHLLPGYNYFFDLKWHQRSVDTFLGLPFNITSYALLMRVIGELTNMLPNKLIGDLSNVHFYQPHIQLIEEQLQRSPFTHSEPDFEFSERIQQRFQHFRDGQATLDEILNEIEIKDFEFKEYESYPAIEAEMYEPKK